MAIVPNKANPGGPVDKHLAARGDDITQHFRVTPSDTFRHDPMLRGVVSQATGNIVTLDREGNLTTHSVVAGQLVEGYFVRVMATGTDVIVNGVY